MASQKKRVVLSLVLIAFGGLINGCTSLWAPSIAAKAAALRSNSAVQSGLQVQQVASAVGGTNYALCKRCIGYGVVDVASALTQ